MCMCMIIVWENHVCTCMYVCMYTYLHTGQPVCNSSGAIYFFVVIFAWLDFARDRAFLRPGAHQVTNWIGLPGNPRISFFACSAQGLSVHNTIPSFFMWVLGIELRSWYLQGKHFYQASIINVPTAYSSKGVKRMSFSVTERGLLSLTS